MFTWDLFSRKYLADFIVVILVLIAIMHISREKLQQVNSVMIYPLLLLL